MKKKIICDTLKKYYRGVIEFLRQLIEIKNVNYMYPDKFRDVTCTIL